MAENKEYMNAPEGCGNLHISEDVVASIAIGAAKDVEGVSSVAPIGMSDYMKKGNNRGARIVTEGDSLVIDLFLIVEYGVVIPDVAKKVQCCVTSSVEAMTGYKVAAVNVNITGVHLS